MGCSRYCRLASRTHVAVCDGTCFVDGTAPKVSNSFIRDLDVLSSQQPPRVTTKCCQFQHSMQHKHTAATLCKGPSRPNAMQFSDTHTRHSELAKPVEMPCLCCNTHAVVTNTRSPCQPCCVEVPRLRCNTHPATHSNCKLSEATVPLLGPGHGT